MANQNDLPGMSDRKIEALQDAAEEYAKKRDRRMKLLAEEVELKGELLKLMKRHKKEEYVYDGITISIVPGEETVKVRIAKAKDEEEQE